MAEVLVEFVDPVVSSDGTSYTARACGAGAGDEKWEGWIEFIPIGPGEPVRSGRETTQPNRQDTEYWATGLTPVFLEGALARALNPLRRPAARQPKAPVFDKPAQPLRANAPASVLDPFSVYQKGETLLRGQLSAMAGWHLVNIITAYRLSDQDPVLLQATEPVQLVELIIDAVREETRQAK